MSIGMSEHSGMTSNLPAADVRNWTLTLSSQNVANFRQIFQNC